MKTLIEDVIVHLTRDEAALLVRVGVKALKGSRNDVLSHEQEAANGLMGKLLAIANGIVEGGK